MSLLYDYEIMLKMNWYKVGYEVLCALLYYGDVNVLISNVKGCIERCYHETPIKLKTMTI